jgi:hypothetical protein
MKLYNIKYIPLSIALSDPTRTFSTLKLEQLLDILEIYHATVKIQRFLRRKFSADDTCPISLEPVKYPLYGFKTNSKFIYYNLQDLTDYLIETGDFRDPKTRNEYSIKNIVDIDNEIMKNGIQIKVPELKSLVHAYKKKQYYIDKKRLKDTVLNYERVLDEYVNALRLWIESSHNTPEDIYFNRDRIATNLAYTESLLERLYHTSEEDYKIYINALFESLRKNYSSNNQEISYKRDIILYQFLDLDATLNGLLH